MAASGLNSRRSNGRNEGAKWPIGSEKRGLPERTAPMLRLRLTRPKVCALSIQRPPWGDPVERFGHHRHNRRVLADIGFGQHIRRHFLGHLSPACGVVDEHLGGKYERSHRIGRERPESDLRVAEDHQLYVVDIFTDAFHGAAEVHDSEYSGTRLFDRGLQPVDGVGNRPGLLDSHCLGERRGGHAGENCCCEKSFHDQSSVRLRFSSWGSRSTPQRFAAIQPATRRASRPTPATIVEDTAYWKCSPAK